MESGLKSLSSFLANSPASLMAFPHPPLLPLPAHLQASPPPQQSPSWPAAARSPRKPPAASAPIVAVLASPSKKRAAGAGQEEVAGWTSMEYPMYSVSPPPSSVPMPTSLLLPAAAGRKKAPLTACAVQVVAGAACGGVDVGATDELRRLLRL